MATGTINNGLVANVKAHGAKGDGSTDDTAAIQATIDVVTGVAAPATNTRHADAPVFLPRGTYKVTAPLLIRSVEGFELRGVGRETIIQASGTFSPILDLNGVAHCRFTDFSVRGTASGTNTNAVLLRWNGMQRSTTMNAFDNVFIEGGNWVVGWQVSDNANQVDENSWYNCRVSGAGRADGTYWQHGWKLGSEATGNGLDSFIYHGNVSACRYGVSWAGHGGGWFGGAMQNNEIDFNEMVRCADIITVKGSRNEGSKRLWASSIGSGGYVNQVSVEDIYWGGASIDADGFFIKVQKGGFHTFKNIFVSGAGGVSPQVVLGNGTLGPGHVILENVSTKTAGASFVIWDSNITYDLTYFQNDDSDVLTTGPYKFTNVGVIATASLPAAGATQNGRLVIEDNGAGDRNLILYAGGQRFRIDGGAAF